MNDEDEGILFGEMMIQGKRLKDCQPELEVKNGHCRLYVNRKEVGFNAIAIEIITCSDGNDMWNCPELRVEKLFEATAYADGVRHLIFHGEMDGYFNYPNMPGLIEILQKVREIEVDMCRILKLKEKK